MEQTNPLRFNGADYLSLVYRQSSQAGYDLLDEELLRSLGQASIRAQESERQYISQELHDNVNQILISAKLFMDTAKRNVAQRTALIDKAIEYQMLALEEIRKLSKKLNNSLVKTVGLKNSIDDIVNNMREYRGMEVDFVFPAGLEEKLNDEQQLMVFRIIQEQTTNIIKYAEASKVEILLGESAGNINLLIRDNGQGFETSQKNKGIGFINIISRAHAYHGNVNITSSPGNGCKVEVDFPAS